MAVLKKFLLYLLCFLLFGGAVGPGEGDTRYLLYSVNPGEGFNLRRDVYMRAANLVKTLRSEGAKTGQGKWVLVLPPWPRLYHWRSKDLDQWNVKWERFFDVPSLNEYIPVMEFDDYVKQEGSHLEEVLWLQHFPSGWDKWEEQAKTAPCSGHTPYSQASSGVWRGGVLGSQALTADEFRCVSVMGFSKTLVPELLGRRRVLVEHMEVVMHDRFGGPDYWRARASMVYAQHLKEVGDDFMKTSLGYKRKGEGAGGDRGGNYLAVHLRRQDYTYARPADIPSLEGAAKQINSLKQLQNLKTVFMATDAPSEERKVLSGLVKGLVWFTPTQHELHLYGDGGMAIIDQWIASHAKFFIGSFESTFSFRIREDRQLMGFSKDSTFNQLCGSKDNEADHTSCDPPTYWELPEEVRAAVVKGEVGGRTEL